MNRSDVSRRRAVIKTDRTLQGGVVTSPQNLHCDNMQYEKDKSALRSDFSTFPLIPDAAGGGA